MWLLSLLHPLVQPEVEWLFDFDSFSTCTPLLGGHVNSCEKQRVQHHNPFIGISEVDSYGNRVAGMMAINNISNHKNLRD
jgi:hypothetical protein